MLVSLLLSNAFTVVVAMNSLPVPMTSSSPQPGDLSSVSNLVEAPSVEELFNFPDADIILRSSNSRDFPVLKLYITKSSPVLYKLIQNASDSVVSAHPAGPIPLPVINMPESGAILHSLLTFGCPSPLFFLQASKRF